MLEIFVQNRKQNPPQNYGLLIFPKFSLAEIPDLDKVWRLSVQRLQNIFCHQLFITIIMVATGECCVHNIFVSDCCKWKFVFIATSKDAYFF